jgi:hypothetical protein
MLFEWTGNPFVDNGIGAMLAHAQGDKEEPDELSSKMSSAWAN